MGESDVFVVKVTVCRIFF